MDFEQKATLDDPADAGTPERCILDFSERETHAGVYRLHRDLLRLRREHAAFSSQRPGGIDGAVLSDQAFLLRFFTDDHREDRVLMVNLGTDLTRSSVAEPLLAPPSGCEWMVLWSSEDPKYGGLGTGRIWPDGRGYVPRESAVVLSPTKSSHAAV